MTDTKKNKKKAKNIYTRSTNKIEKLNNKPSYTLDIVLAVIIVISILIFIGNMEIGGIVGNFISNVLFGVFGLICYAFPIFLIANVVYYFINRNDDNTKLKIGLFSAFFILLSMFIELITHNNSLVGPLNAYRIGFAKHIGGGFVGGSLAEAFVSLVGLIGAYALCLLLMLIISIFAFSYSPFDFFYSFFSKIRGKMTEKKKLMEEELAKEKDYKNRKEDDDSENRDNIYDTKDSDESKYEEPESPYTVSFSVNKKKSRINSNIHPGRNINIEQEINYNLTNEENGRLSVDNHNLKEEKANDLSKGQLNNESLTDDLEKNFYKDNVASSPKEQTPIRRMDKIVRGTSFNTEIAPVFSNSPTHSDDMSEIDSKMLDDMIKNRNIESENENIALVNTESTVFSEQGNESYQSNLNSNNMSLNNMDISEVRVENVSPKKETWQDIWKKETYENSDSVTTDVKLESPINIKENSDTDILNKNIESTVLNDNIDEEVSNENIESSEINEVTENSYTPVDSKENSYTSVDATDNTISTINQAENEVSPVSFDNHKEDIIKEYVFPPIDILTQNKKSVLNSSDNSLQETAEKLETILKNFGVNVKVTGYSRGPAVTRYELLPELGVKVSKIVNLSDDIKMNLAATDIRIEAPIPGKTAIGIEVPNKNKAVVGFRELIETSEFKDANSKISFALGLDLAGNIVVSDISVMPHLLIAGATGSGKSVCINTIIMSILYKARPDDVRFIMIDPKVVELSVYNGIPHLLIPVVTDPKKAAGALRWVVNEMMNRYKLFAENKVRDIKGYNEKIVDGKITKVINGENVSISVKKMPKIVVIVDELADLMMVAAKDVEESICRIAQLARAAGIHLIIATQRPSVNVITGLIKANMPSRIAFSVTSGIDSRTILDTVGAERLLGKGDMLYHPQNKSKPIRVQGAFVTDKDVSAVTRFIKENNVPTEESKAENEEILQVVNSDVSTEGFTEINDNSDYNNNEKDEYFYDAARLLIEKDKGSIGMLQRNFKIGFNRAARIIDQLEEFGVVGPEVGTKPRKILVTLEEFENMMNNK